MNIGILILMIVGGGVGILSSLYIAFSFPAMIIWKIYRKIRHGYKLTYSSSILWQCSDPVLLHLVLTGSPPAVCQITVSYYTDNTYHSHFPLRTEYYNS